MKVEVSALPPSLQRPSIMSQPSLPALVPYDRNKARMELYDLFKPLCSDQTIITDSQRHLAILRSLRDMLPNPLKPVKIQMESPHFYGIDMIASPSLRERLMTVTLDLARSFVDELGILKSEVGSNHPITIWGDNPLDEMSWELSRPMLERWGWLLGSEWIHRTNFWRRQRGTHLLPEW